VSPRRVVDASGRPASILENYRASTSIK